MDKIGAFEIPVCGLEESVRNLGVLHRGTTGEACPKCGGTDFRKCGNYKYKGEKHPIKLCADCGYKFSTVDPEKGFSYNRVARIFNLDNNKVDTLIDDAIQFGIIKKNKDDTYSRTALGVESKNEVYHRVPLYAYLLDTIGYTQKRRVFESALRSHPEEALSRASKIKRDVLWRRYKEIATEVFICEKQCKFSRTCKKVARDILCCDVVEKVTAKNTWKVDIEL